MINIISKPLELDYELKKKIEFICDFCNTKKKQRKRRWLIIISHRFIVSVSTCANSIDFKYSFKATTIF